MENQVHTFYIGSKALDAELLVKVRDYIDLNHDGKYLVLSEEEKQNREEEIVSEYPVNALEYLCVSLDGTTYYLYRQN